MAIRFSPPGSSPKSAPVKSPLKTETSEEAPMKRAKKPKPEKAPMGEKVFFAQRIDSAVAEEFKKLPGSPSKNLQQAMIDYMGKK